MPDRMLRIDELIQQEISTILQNDAELIGSLSVTSVQTARDFSESKILIVPLDPSLHPDLEKTLNHKAGEYRHALTKKLNLRRIPQLTFIVEQDPEALNKVDELFDQIQKEHQ